MIASEIQQRSPYVYGEILSRSLYQAPPPELPGIGRFLSQGTAAGAFTSFLVALLIVLSQPTNGWNMLIIFLLPFLLAAGMICGLFEGLAIWGCSRLANRRLNPIARAGIGLLLLALFSGAYYLIFPHSARHLNPTPEGYIFVGVSYLLIAVGCALAAGSRLQPWRELVRGAKAVPSQSRLLTGITGLVLRVVVLFLLMETFLALTCVLQQEPPQRDLVFTVIALAHFLAASVVLFARVKFWLLLPLTLIVNIPIAFAITKEFYRVADSLFFYVLISYLAMWAAFLLTRWSLTHSALAFLKEELRYYLID